MAGATPRDLALDVQQEGDRPVTRVFRHTLIIARFFQRVIEEEAAAVGLQRGEFLVLMTLERAGEDGLTPTELYRSLVVTSGAVSKRIDALSARGLVARGANGNDGRSRRVRLTPVGRALAATVRANENAMQRIGDTFGRERLEQLDSLLAAYIHLLPPDALDPPRIDA